MSPTDLRLNPTPIIVTVLGMLLALFLGVFIGGSEALNLALIFGIVTVIAVVAVMRQHVWLLIPIFWGFDGSVPVLPLPFSVRDLALILVAPVSVALFALRVFRFKNKWGILDWLLLLNVAQVLIAFITHPFGLYSSGSERVGARPYFNIAMASVAYFILSNQSLSPALARRLPILIILLELFSSALFIISRVFKSVGFVLGAIYDAYLPPTYRYGFAPSFERLTGAGRGGLILITGLCSYCRPLALITPTRLWRPFLLMIGLALVLTSGFRSQLITVAAIFLLASYFRKGWSDVAVCLVGLFFAVSALICFNSFISPLPLAMQRTLSALPGQWDTEAVKDAEDSTAWRLQMWRDLGKGTRYIRDKIMGDGFGFSRAELSAMERRKFILGDIGQEDSMIIGSFHNGPLSAVRFVGIVGMVLYYALLIYLAVCAWRIIRASERTDYLPLAFFFGLALIWEPINYTLIFGAFDSGLPDTIFNVGMLKMIDNSLRLRGPEEGKATSTPVSSRHPFQYAS